MFRDLSWQRFRAYYAWIISFMVVNKLPMNNNRKRNLIKVLFIYTIRWLSKRQSDQHWLAPTLDLILRVFKSPKYKNLLSLAKKNRILCKRITPILIFLYFNCVRNFSQRVIVYMFSLDIHSFGFSPVPWNIMRYLVQYFCQWLHYDNLWKIRTS